MSRYLILLLCLALLCGCVPTKTDDRTPLPEVREEVVSGAEVFCLVETEEEAETIAALYDIQLVSLEAGVATFHAEHDWYELIEKGKKEGWPELSPNSIINIEE